MLQLAREQRRRGHDVVVVTGSLASGEESMEYAADEFGVSVRNCRLSSGRSRSARISQRFALRRILLERKPDVLHTHTSKAGATGRIATLLARAARPRSVVHTYHGHVLSGYFIRRASDSSVGSSGCSRAPTDTLDRRQRRGTRRSRRVRRGIGRPLRRRPLRLRSPGLERSRRRGTRAHPRRARRREETFVIGWAGRLTPIKRPLDLVRTLKCLLDRGVDAVLVLVGDGEDRPRRRRWHGTSMSRALPLRRLPAANPRLVRRLRRLAPDLRERGHACRGD